MRISDWSSDVCSSDLLAFVTQIINDSREHGLRVLWFSSLLSKAENLPAVRKQLQRVGAIAVREVVMAQGNKRSRFVAWTFLDAGQHEQWRQTRRSEEHTSELQSLMRISYAVFC